MNNSNYGYPHSTFSSPYASTPSTSIRPNRPRFGYSGPSLYPRPRSSASKPNPDSYSDSMINNYGNSTSRIDMSYGSENGNSYDDTYKNNSGSNYYSANDTLYPEPYSTDSSMARGGIGPQRSNFAPSDMKDMHNSGGMYPNPSSQYGTSTHFGASTYSYNNPSFGGMNNGGEQLPSQKSLFSSLGITSKKQTFSARKFGKAKRKMTTQPGKWRCDLCNLDFTSQIPHDMHLRGAKHAKKLKAKDAMMVVQSKATVGSSGEKTFFCMLCNVTANSSLQFQTHLDGNKHKNKLNPKDPAQDSKDETAKDAKKNAAKTDADASLSGKTNGSLTRPLPSDFDQPQAAKLMKFSCDICSVTMNSSIQLEQHMSSKKHQNKVEGKPTIKVRKNKGEKKDAMDTTDTVTGNESTETAAASGDSTKTVVGVKTLSSSFVQGGTLQ